MTSTTLHQHAVDDQADDGSGDPIGGGWTWDCLLCPDQPHQHAIGLVGAATAVVDHLHSDHQAPDHAGGPS